MRKRPLVAILIVLQLPLSASTVSARSNNGSQRKPDVVVLLADDPGIGDVCAYNANHIPTPQIHCLETHGIRFTDAQVSAAVCMPSRAVLITGWRGISHGSEIYADPGPNLDEQNIDDLLKRPVYSTVVIGKWRLGE